MATTTQILFNSPALHSLKRDQLVKLCKIHSVKANGKNSEMIERLKQRALELPPEALNTATDEEDMDLGEALRQGKDEDVSMGDAQQQQEDQDMPGGMLDSGEDSDMQGVVLTSRFAIPRPSEQWEVVMEDIVEEDECPVGTMSSKNSLRTISNGEFGTHSSKTSVSSSIKALATSLGIKRVTSKSSHHTQDIDIDAEGGKMPSFSPGKIFGSTRARDSLAEHATPYSQIPPSDSLPETDHFKFSTPDTSILGMDEDANESTDNDDAKSIAKSVARLGVPFSGPAIKSTIRLVSHPAASKDDKGYAYMSPPRLPIVQTDFDLTVGTPGTIRTLNMWPASPRTFGGDTESLYPKLPLEDLKPRADDEDEEEMPGGMGSGLGTTTPAKTSTRSKASMSSRTHLTNARGVIDERDIFSPAKPAVATPGSASTLPRSTPFLFGSPLPKREPGSAIKHIDKKEPTVGVSNAAFDNVAKSVLEEMHRRLAEATVQKGDTSTSKPAPTSQAPPIFGGLTFGVPTSGTQGGANATMDRFKKAHDAEFSKMDSIANHYAARRTNKRKSDALGHGASRPMAGQKRRSSAAGARVISAGSRKRQAVPGGFGADDDDEESGREEEEEQEQQKADEDEDAGARRSSKRMRITQGWDVHKGQRVSLAPPLPPAEEEKKQRELEAVKRQLDAAKARRRSSRGRPSMGAQPAKGKTSRFGFLASAKSLVRNVWNIGGGSKAKPAANAAPSSIPVPKPTQAPAAAPSTSVDKKGKGKVDNASKPAAASTRKVSGSQPRPPSVSSTTNKLLKPPSADVKVTGTMTSTRSNSSRARSPIPSFNAPSGTVKSTTTFASGSGSTAGTARSRISSTGSNAGTAASRQAARTSTVSSMGARTSVTGSSAAASSMGTRRSMASMNTLTSSSSKQDNKAPADVPQPSLRKRTSSLLAPTASSLAKTNSAVVKPSMSGRTSGLPSVAEAQKPKRASITQPTTSRATLMAAKSPMSPRPTRIFSQPLTNFSSPASSTGAAATPVHASLTGAASSIMAVNNVASAGADAASSPSKIPRPAVLPPKPKQLIARKPRISRSRVIAKLGAQRAAAAQGTAVIASPTSGRRTRSSVGVAARRSFGGVKSSRASAGSEALRGAMVKKRARQSEYMRRKSRAANENDAVAA